MRNVVHSLIVSAASLLPFSFAAAQEPPAMVPLPVEESGPAAPIASSLSQLAKDLAASSITDRQAAVSSGVSISPAVIAEVKPAPCFISAGADPGLTDGFESFAYNLDQNASAKIGAFVAGELNGSDRVTLYRFMLYRDLTDDSGRAVGTCGAGVQLSLRIRNASATINTTLPYLAASAQLGLAEVEYRLKTFGMSGPGILSAIPAAAQIGQFDTAAYAALLRSIDHIQQNINSPDPKNKVTITPKLVEIVNDAPRVGFERQLTTQILALRKIKDGKKCADARNSIPGRNTSTDVMVEEVYVALMGQKACKEGLQPSNETRQQLDKLFKDAKLEFK